MTRRERNHKRGRKKREGREGEGKRPETTKKVRQMSISRVQPKLFF